MPIHKIISCVEFIKNMRSCHERKKDETENQIGSLSPIHYDTIWDSVSRKYPVKLLVTHCIRFYDCLSTFSRPGHKTRCIYDQNRYKKKINFANALHGYCCKCILYLINV